MKTINAGATLLGLCFYLLIGFVAAKADAGESGANASNRVSGGMTRREKTQLLGAVTSPNSD
jgi:hypothetical protein